MSQVLLACFPGEFVQRRLYRAENFWHQGSVQIPRPNPFLESCIPAQVVAAVDVNNIANEVYNYNFPHTQLLAKTIEGITLEEFERLSFDMILMSPPCQPFTRIGLQGDVTDPRTNSFMYILDILPRLQKLPKYILLENVKGFEISSTRDLLIQTIESCGFQYQEFLLSPTSLGIPNSRLRYFLIAKLQSEPLPFQAPGQVLMEFPKNEYEHTQKRAIDAENTIEGKKIEPNVSFDSSKQCSEKEAILFKLETAGEIERKHQQDSDLSVQMLKDFLEDDADTSQYFLPPKPLLRYALLLDIVKPTCRRSMCFTKGYGRYIEGTGSVLQTAEDVQIENIYKSLTSLSQEEKIKKLLMLKLRYFTPKEIANLHGFPPEFGFPENVTMKQRYRLLGNSLNVHVVAKLIKILCE
ncbi:tRNA (cytosine(38)-C(5))-methyltransferase isoform X1 [Rousettus aegyptiacus]|uniref:tRNA (cytosine(38)-C(5))-methyltransferase isoform X1 n=3 Tax=Rousettus aegyptiacus TaxID=9407 RepID=UPI00168D173B|nr:tRNA (cytosine(38)-C(5))-methyltransferase isoform X1 [Rousettus aegyptiacus]XP_036082817.1 tRNA (cytosine(38)-C(5))-methyltransferase isoform X1 [Rousettus aegyptiacus]XP_036082821.1 tRNA (cytosine(38)-C(5))-methyltransferase isoform X1 [Rousettus aegyptiacus]XP_036082823.1 tRNA (cytosine(38)-C(5))-methyltransferase isoform X1 [Rousettus aegyptiacus]